MRTKRQRKIKVNFPKLMRVLAITFVLLFSTIFMFKSTADGSTSDSYVKVTVCPGDTLWTIAKQHFPNDNIQESIYTIMLYNNLESSDLRPGDTIKVPTES